MKRVFCFLLCFAFSSLLAQVQPATATLSPTSVQSAFKQDVSQELRSMSMIAPLPRGERWEEAEIPNKFLLDRASQRNLVEVYKEKDLVVQNAGGANSPFSTLVNFDGITNLQGVYPPDPNTDVGLNHVIETVNSSFAIYSKTGTLMYGPADLGTIWQFFPGPWSTSLNDGDPVVLYDHLANRWVVTQFSLPSYPNGPFYELIAISQTADPLGAWHRYAFTYTNMPDYPKLGVWPDGYYMSINSFSSGAGTWMGPAVAVFERDSMLAGKTARMVFFQLSSTLDPLLPSDLDGIAPPAGSPNYFLMVVDGAISGGVDRLDLYKFAANWTSPAASTFTGPTTLNTAAFDMNMCGGVSGCIGQSGTSVKLDALADRILYRLQYRNFGSYETLLASHTVDANGSDRAGVRWYELRKTGATWGINQQSTYSPDANNRWMGSVAMDGLGNIALGYSVSSASMFPAIRATGRRSTDPSGQMTFGEQTIVAGGGSQTGTANRWGDYTSMVVDPADDQTFWYTNEYYSSTSSTGWKTRIASFKIDNLPSSVGLQVQSYSLVGGNGNTSIDPNECNQLSLTLLCGGPSSASGISASLSTSTPNVTIVDATSAYPNITAGSTGVNSIPYSISTSSSFVCGTPVQLALTITHALGTDVVNFTATSGGAGSATNYNNNTATTIPDNTPAGIDIPVTVAGFSGSIAKVTASFYITHTYDSDLNISLVGPDNTSIPLVSARGSSGDNFGTACATRTILDDAASTAIASGTAPFAGSYRPESPLSAFSGKSGSAVNGTWKLHIADIASQDIGILQCWTLALSPSSCTSGSGSCQSLPVQIASFTGFSSGAGSVTLNWTTVSEINNYGFEIQKASQQAGPFATLPGSFVSGHGTTLEPQHYRYLDVTAVATQAFYRLKQLDLDGTVHYLDPIHVNLLTGVDEKSVPATFSLAQNFPNPFNPTTIIRYGLATTAEVRLEVFNTLGQRVALLANERQEAGYHQATFDAKSLSSGVYFYKLTAGNFVDSKKLLLVK